MKSIKPFSIALMTISLMAYSCGGGSQESTETETAILTPAEKPLSLEDKYKDDPVYVAGLAKINQSDCPSCHMVERKIVGPSYAEVAAKYESTEENIEMLASHVMNGHVGTWGEVPMPAHPTLSQEDAEDMVRYVLLLKE